MTTALSLHTDLPLYRFRRRSPMGADLGVISAADSGLNEQGIRMSHTPEGGCVELTLNAINGPITDGDTLYPGFGLASLDGVQVEITSVPDPQESDWLPIWYGEVTTGGNAHDVEGEDMVWRGMPDRLATTVIPDGASPQEVDAGQAVRNIMGSVLNTGALGRCVLYDETLIPMLGFTFTLAAGQEVLLGPTLDLIVSQAAEKLDVLLAYGVMGDRRFYFGLAKADTAVLAPEQVLDFAPKAPVGTATITAVKWAIGRRSNGEAIYYTSLSPAAARYGQRVAEQSVPSGVSPLQQVQGAVTASGGSASSGTSTHPSDPLNTQGGTTDSSADPTKASDSNLSSWYAVTAPDGSTPVSLSWTLTDDAVDFSLSATIQGLTPPRIEITLPAQDSPAFTLLPPLDSTQSVGRWNWAGFNLGVGSGLPKGTQIALKGDRGDVSSKKPLIAVTDFRAYGVDRALLDGQAQFFYSLPSPAPAEIPLDGYLLPGEGAGHVSASLPTGLYVERVATYETLITTADGFRSHVMAGQPDDPKQLARAALIRQNAARSAASAINGVLRAL